MRRRIRFQFVYLFLASLFLCGHPIASAAGDPSADSPDILIIMADDATYSDLPLCGGRNVRTPNIDSLAEDHLHDHFPADPETDRPATPVMPGTLMIEGMAQTAGILVGHARDFTEKVILAKIGRSGFDRDVFPGQTLIYTAGGSTAASPPRSSSPPARSSASPSSSASSTPPITRTTAPLPG